MARKMKSEPIPQNTSYKEELIKDEEDELIDEGEEITDKGQSSGAIDPTK